MAEWEKRYNDAGEVAVLVSPGFGAGWSTWAQEHLAQMAMDRRFVDAKLANLAKAKITGLLTEVFGENAPYAGGWDKTEIEWLAPGTVFEITEYDGSESLHVISFPNDFLIA